MKVVLIPVFRRPEFLTVCLEYIRAATYCDNYHYVFLCDFGYSLDNLQVINQFPLSKEIIKRGKHKFKPITKQSYNLLEGYRYAVELGAEKVYLIEDDIFIANDFFKWHEQAQQLHPLTIATANNNTKFEVSNDLTQWYLGANADYQSLGVCWDAELLKELVLPHANDNYYKDPVGYCIKHLPGNIIGRHFVEQDGLIRRCIQDKVQALFPHVPRAFHAGFIGYNRRGRKPEGVTVDQKAKRVKEIATDPELMKRYVERPEYYEDSKPINLVNENWEQLCI